MNIKTTRTRLSRPGALAICLGALALAIPSGASGSYGSVSPQGPDRKPVAKDSGLVIPDHTALNQSLAPVSGSPGAGGEAPAMPPLVASPSISDGFDWADAALGAGVVMGVVAFGGAALLTVRRRVMVSS